MFKRWIPGLLLALALALGNATTANAACALGFNGSLTATSIFLPCGGEQSYVVPAGVSKLRVRVIGAKGGDRFGLGGLGGRTDAIIDTTGGSTLYALVGGTGDSGGFNGGGLGSAANITGGGASDVRTVSCGLACPGAVASATLNSRLVIGGGGGGAGPCGTTGGNGGSAAGGNGGNGGSCAADTQFSEGGTQTAGGAGGGVQGTGGSATNGGGGGGGLYGGGTTTGTRGGGGGSSYGPAGTTFVPTSTGARVELTPYLTTSTAVTGTGTSKYGEDVTLTATISHPGTVGGTVQFYDDATALGSPQAVGPFTNQATLTTSALNVASHTISAVYSGDVGATPSTSPDETHLVNKQDTTSATTTSLSPAGYGASVTFTTTVTPSAGPAAIEAGNVQFYDGPNPIGSPQPIDTTTRRAVLTTSSLNVGVVHQINARFLGSASYAATPAAGATSVAQIISPAATSTSLSSSVNPAALGASVTFTATVTPASGALTGGSVQFFDGATPLGAAVSVNTSTGVATLTTSALSPATHTITARYGSASTHATSTSSALSQVVNAGATSTTATSSPNPSDYGQSVTFTATVAPAVGTLDGGTVQFSNGSDPLGAPVSVNTATGVATLTTSALTPGSHTITATYGGTATYVTSSSAGISQVVNKGDVDLTLTGTPNPAAFGERVSFTATVDPAAGTLDGGSVRFFDDGTLLETVNVNTTTGIATFDTTTLASGVHTITATYGGTATYLAAAGAPLSLRVNPAPTPTPTPAPAAPLTPTPTPAAEPTVVIESLKERKAKSNKPSQLLLNKRAVTLRVSCGASPCRITARGKVTIGGVSFGSLIGPRPRNVPAQRTITLRLRSSLELRRRVRAHLIANPSAQARMTIKVTYKGKTKTRTKTIKVGVRTQ